MAIQARSREQLRVSIGYNLNAIKLVEADASGSTSTFITDDIPIGGADEHIGKWIVFTSGTNDGEIRQVTDSSVSSNQQTLTFYPVAAATASPDTAELWDGPHDPAIIHDLINQAITDATGIAWDRVEDTSLFSDGIRRRYDVPDGIEMLTRLEFRESVKKTKVHLCERTFDETPNAGEFTQAIDTEDYRRGSSLKITIAVGADAGEFTTDSIDSTDLTGYTHIEGWIKSTTTLAAADYVIHLDNGTVTADGNDKESLDVPAVATARRWTPFSIALDNPEEDGALISIGIEMNVDKGAHTVWFDEIVATRQDDANWASIPTHLWHIDKEARDLVLSTSALRVAPYNKLKLVGGDVPATLDTDATATEIDGFYIIAYVTAHALMAKSGGTTDADAHGTRAGLWFRRMEQAKRALNPVIEPRRLVS